MKPLPDDALRHFVSQILRIPIYSAAHEKARLTQDTRVVFYADGYHAVRVFPILTEESATLIKDAYREEVEAIIARGDLDLVKQLPVSLEEMTNQTVRDINPAPVWRLEKLHETHSFIGGYELRALRYATDPVTRFPCVMMTYEREASPNLEVYLIGMPLSKEVDTTLRHIQMEEAKKMAAAAEDTSTIKTPSIATA